MPQGLLITLTTSPTVVAGNGIHGVIRVKVYNSGTGTGYLGGADVTTAGYPFTTAHLPQELLVVAGETLYGTSTGAAVLSVLRMGETTSS